MSSLYFVRDQNLAAILSAYYAELQPFLDQCDIPFTLDRFKEEYQEHKVKY